MRNLMNLRLDDAILDDAEGDDEFELEMVARSCNAYVVDYICFVLFCCVFANII